VRDHSTKPFDEVAYCYLGDARNNTANSLLVTGALLGADVRLAAPEALLPSAEVREIAERLATSSGARLMLTADHNEAVAGADFLYTDVWLSMGEPEEEWGERITQLLPYQVNSALLTATGNPAVKFLHCLPALHNRETEVGEQIFDKRGLDALEVTDEVFESMHRSSSTKRRIGCTRSRLIATLER
jgi:ornithine carbamoyltransferase